MSAQRVLTITRFLLIRFLLVWCGAIACVPAARANSVVTIWDDMMLQAIRQTRPGPPTVARMTAVLHTCIFDAWAAYDDVAVGTLYGAEIRRPAEERTLENKSQAVSFAAYRALIDLFPQPDQIARFQAAMLDLGYDPTDGSTDVTTPTGVGNVCAQAVLDLRHRDGSNQLGDLNGGAPYSDYTGYDPVNTPDLIYDPNRWQPLRVPDGMGGFNVQKYIGPHWGLVKPFAMTSGSQFRPVQGPALYPSPAYLRQALQLLQISANLTDRQKAAAEYWADGPNSELPPGHWCLLTSYVCQRDGYLLDDDVKIFFCVSNALLDASICAWEAKRHWDSVRPITAIHFLFGNTYVRAWGGPYQGTQYIRGSDWQPYQSTTFVTPPFAEYISGHSIFSAASAEILKRYTGSDEFGASVTIPAGSSFVEPGAVPAEDITLAWKTFSDAADEAGISRRYGGIHFEDGDLFSRKAGRLVAALVWEKAQSYINGTVQR